MDQTDDSQHASCFWKFQGPYGEPLTPCGILVLYVILVVCGDIALQHSYIVGSSILLLASMVLLGIVGFSCHSCAEELLRRLPRAVASKRCCCCLWMLVSLLVTAGVVQAGRTTTNACVERTAQNLFVNSLILALIAFFVVAVIALFPVVIPLPKERALDQALESGISPSGRVMPQCGHVGAPISHDHSESSKTWMERSQSSFPLMLCELLRGPRMAGILMAGPFVVCFALFGLFNIIAGTILTVLAFKPRPVRLGEPSAKELIDNFFEPLKVVGAILLAAGAMLIFVGLLLGVIACRSVTVPSSANALRHAASLSAIPLSSINGPASFAGLTNPPSARSSFPKRAHSLMVPTNSARKHSRLSPSARRVTIEVHDTKRPLSAAGVVLSDQRLVPADNVTILSTL